MGIGLMNVVDVIEDAGLMLAFYGFGLASGVFICWIETRVR